MTLNRTVLVEGLTCTKYCWGKEELLCLCSNYIPEAARSLCSRGYFWLSVIRIILQMRTWTQGGQGIPQRQPASECQNCEGFTDGLNANERF